MTYTEHEYRTGLKRYANSDLSELAGKPRFNVKPETLLFGTAFHTIVLERHRKQEVITQFAPPELLALFFMEQNVSQISDLRIILQDGLCEQVRIWTDELTGLPLKAKIDCIVQPKQQHIIDLKTTACKTREAFLDSCLDYNYDRQGAFYLSSDPAAKYFEIVGVQKQPPYQVFRCPFSINSDFIQGGMRKMRYLLMLAKEEADKPNGWRPSSWSRIEQEATK
ncbi:PD-(D/E)XK nuclease-like domain-containing protein [Fibrella sp. ES10-3-2-2]|nr:hypothetical protein A6C57_23285 [Fibrella sp. ES10-3-2-2]